VRKLLTKGADNRLRGSVENPITTEQVARLYTVYILLGPIARLCLNTIAVKTEDDFHETWHKYIGDVDREIQSYICKCNIQTLKNSVFQDGSDRIAMIEPGPSQLSYEARITTQWIAHRFVQVGVHYTQRGCYELYQQLASQQMMRTAAGWLFEGYAHQWLERGGMFMADALSFSTTSSSRVPLVFTTKKSKSDSDNHFRTAKELVTKVKEPNGLNILNDMLGRYFLPHAQNQASYDGVVFISPNTVLLMQITIAESHDIKEKGLKDLCKYLPAKITNIWIVFVIPADRILHYTREQKVPEVSDMILLGSSQQRSIRQFRLVLTEHDILKQSSCNQVTRGWANDNEGTIARGNIAWDDGDTLMAG